MAAKQLKVTQIGSPVGRPPDQRATLVGLGLNKISRSKIWPDEPAVRGRINKVRHLVRVEEVEGGTKPAAKRKTKSRS